MEIEKIVKRQRSFYETGAMLSYEARRNALCKLRQALVQYEGEIAKALYADLHRSPAETYMVETGVVKAEITEVLKHLKKWMKPERVSTGLANFPGKSRTMAEPYGVVLVIAPWNYPLNLCLDPVVDAIAAGNCVVLKPSEYAPATSALLKKMVEEFFTPEFFTVVEGGVPETTELLEQRFDYIFYTGGMTVGRIILEKAAKYLTPVTLELGGKSPCIVDKNANILLAARRIIFGKILNSGQTCVAPDYLIVHPDVKEELFSCMQKEITTMLGEHPLECEEYPRMVNLRHYERVLRLMEQEKVITGGYGRKESLQIAPTILDEVTLESPVMCEEIFGPVLPTLTFTTKEELQTIIRHFEKPLALYLFTEDKALQDWVLEHIAFGGGCINDTIMHLACMNMGFGGVGHSGMGSYHGKVGFETFSHRKSILKKGTWIDIKMRYHPYQKKYNSLIHIFLK